MHITTALCVTSFTVFSAFATPLLAAETATPVTVEPGSLHRIEVAGRLALAGESLRRETCVYGHESRAMERIIRHAEELDFYIWALRNGTLSEGLEPMTHPKVLEKITTAEPLIDEVSLFFTPENTATLEALAKKTAAIRKALDTQARFSVPDITLAKLATLTARQAADLAAIGADLCQAQKLGDPAGDLQAMAKYLKRYTMVSTALAQGNDSKQIAPPPTARIAEQMTALDRNWAKVLPRLQHIQDSGKIDPLNAVQIQSTLAEMLEQYDYALYLYGTL